MELNINEIKEDKKLARAKIFVEVYLNSGTSLRKMWN